MKKLIERPIKNIQGIEWPILVFTALAVTLLFYLITTSITGYYEANNAFKAVFAFVFSFDFSTNPMSNFLKAGLWITGASLFTWLLYKKPVRS